MELKVGDRVRIVKLFFDDDDTELSVGDMGTVVRLASVTTRQVFVVVFDNMELVSNAANEEDDGYQMYEDQLELVEA